MISRVSCFILLFSAPGCFSSAQISPVESNREGMKQTNKSFSLKNVINLIGNLLLVDAVDGREKLKYLYYPHRHSFVVVGFPRIYLVCDHYPQLFDYPDEIRHNGLETVARQQIDEIDAGSLPFECLAFHSSSHLRSQKR